MSRSFLGLVFSAALISTPAVYASPITLTNPGFDDTSTKVSSGFTGLVNGWSNTGLTYTDSGIESASANAQSPTVYSFLRASDDGAFQLTSTTLQEGDQITLTWYAKNVYHGGEQSVSIITSAGQADPFSSINTRANLTGTLIQTGNGGAYQQFTLSYTATAVDVGNFVGVAFDNPASTPDAYTFFDSFAIDVTPVPEPGVIALGLSALAFLVIVRGHRRLRSTSSSS